MDFLRLSLYLLAMVSAVALAAQLGRVRHSLARLMSAVMAIWAINSASLFILLYALVHGSDSPELHDILMTCNATLLAAMPTILLAWFAREDGMDG